MKLLISAFSIAAYLYALDDRAVEERIQFADNVFRFNQIMVAKLESGRTPTPEEEFIKTFNGCEQVSKLITDFLKSDPTTKNWYVKHSE